MEPWMTVEEAKAWCDIAVEAIPCEWNHRIEDIMAARAALEWSEMERLDLANKFDNEQIGFRFTLRVLTFCAAILRAVKS